MLGILVHVLPSTKTDPIRNVIQILTWFLPTEIIVYKFIIYGNRKSLIFIICSSPGYIVLMYC